MENYDIIIIGGGAAGFFAAINIVAQRPDLSIVILERGNAVLTKVKISGGGRCNVTHAEFMPSEFVRNYPRGEKELLGPFHRFMTGDTITWFEERGIELKIEADGRMFPVTDSSQTIIDCFLKEAHKLGIEILKNHTVKTMSIQEETWILESSKAQFSCNKVLVATGSSPKMWKLLKTLGHTVVEPVPSLFTFDINDERIKDIPGVVAKDVKVKVLGTSLISEGPLLITHVGMSAPAILKLSAFGALELARLKYKFEIEINFIRQTHMECLEHLKKIKTDIPKKLIYNASQFELPKRLWQKLVKASGIDAKLKWADSNKRQLETLSNQLTKAIFSVHGKSTFKEEFVTAGGIDLKEVNFKTFESKLYKNLYFAGEVLNIDAVTGGFNFQNAWSGGFIAAQSMSKD